MKSNCSTANRTSVRVKSSTRSLRSAAASRGSETLCRPSLPTAGGGTAACAAPAKCATASAKWYADSANAPTAVNHSPAAAMDGPSVAVDAAQASAASADASTGAAVQTPTPAAADVAPARPSAIDGAAAKKTSAPHGEGLPTRRTSKRICPAGVRVRPTCRRTAGRPRPTNSRKNTPSAGSHPRRRGRCRVHSPKKIRLLHEIQFFHGESHVGSRQIFHPFPSVGRCVARERNPVPPFAPHCGRGHRGLRRDGEMHHGFGEMVRRFGECPHGGESLPRGSNA